MNAEGKLNVRRTNATSCKLYFPEIVCRTMEKTSKIYIQDLGVIDYKEAWDYQTSLLKSLADNKLAKIYNEKQYFILCEHPPVYTLGKSGSIDHLLLSQDELSQKGYDYYKINRGGDITHHSPGQIVGYPILDLVLHKEDVHWYVRAIEEIIIRTLAEYGIKGERIEKFTGVWILGQPNKKIAAIGVHMSRWITMHGFALNVNNDLSLFDNIVPCGIIDPNKRITSLSAEIGKEFDINEVKQHLIKHFEEVFQVKITQ